MRKLPKVRSVLALLTMTSFVLPASAKIDFSFNVGFGNFDYYMANTSWWNHGYAWRRFYGYIPSNAVPGGFEPGRTLYVCQAYYRGVQPGKVVAGNCNITYAGQEIPMPNFRILVGNGFRWRWGAWGEVPGNAVPGGWEKGHPLYICQARYAGGIHPGKVVGSNCNIGYNGYEIALPEYRVLVWNPGWWGNDTNWNWYVPVNYRPWVMPYPPPYPPPPPPPPPVPPPFPPGPPVPPVPPPFPPGPPVPPPVPPPFPPHPPVPPPFPPGPPVPPTPPRPPVPPPFPPGPPPTPPHPTPFGPPGPGPGPSPFRPPAPPRPFGPPGVAPSGQHRPGNIIPGERRQRRDGDQNAPGDVKPPRFP